MVNTRQHASTDPGFIANNNSQASKYEHNYYRTIIVDLAFNFTLCSFKPVLKVINPLRLDIILKHISRVELWTSTTTM